MKDTIIFAFAYLKKKSKNLKDGRQLGHHQELDIPAIQIQKLHIAAILAKARIGISSVIQPEGHEGESVPLILMIHDASNAAMSKALSQIARLPVVKGRPVMIRVENFD